MKGKIKIRFLIILFFTLIAFIFNMNSVKATEENVIFKDNTLKNKLVEAGYDTNGDNELSKTEMEAITSLSLSSSEITDITGLENAINLTSLNLWNNNVSNITALKDLTQLTYLDLFENNVTDISALRNLTNLTSLNLDHNNITNISVLESLSNLTTLRLDDNNISNINVLGNLSNLTILDIGSNKITDINVLESLSNLTELNIGSNNITDISVLGKLTNLTYLSVGNVLNGNHNHITDISVLENLTRLKSLDLGYCNIKNISSLKNLTDLEHLDLRENSVSDISVLKDLTKLHTLYLEHNDITDISVLANFTNLTYLSLDSNNIVDITSLANLTKLVDLYLSDNHITDINLLENLINLRDLGLSRNELKDISVLENFTKLEGLWLYGNQIENIGILTSLTKLWHVELDSTYDIDKIVPNIPDEIVLNISKNETLEQKVNMIEVPEAYKITYSISSSSNNIAREITLKLILKQTGTELGHKYINIKYISDMTEKLEKILPNQITLNVKESEQEKANKALEESVKNICKVNGIDLEELNQQGFKLNMYVSPLYFGPERFYDAYIEISYHNLYPYTLDKTVKIKYSNTNKHNTNDEKYIKNLKLPTHKYFIYDIKDTNIFNVIEKYYQSKISDKSLKFVVSCGAGGSEPFENITFHGNSFSLAIFKNEMLYDIKQVNNAYIACQITIPENIQNTETEKIKYALPLIKEQIGSTRNVILKKGAKLEGTNIAIEDGYTIVENGIEIGNVILKKQEKVITNIKNCTISNIANQNYTGKAVKPSITIKNGRTTLRNGTDYIVSYKNNTNLGTATVTITGKGNYTGTITKTFKIVVGQVKNVTAKSQDTKSITVKWSKPSGSITGYEVYMATSKKGKYKKVATITKASMTTYKKTKLSAGKNYYFKVRAYKTIKSKKNYGAYSAVLETATKTKTPSISKVTAGKKKATIKWKKVSGATGYEVYMSTSKSKGYKKIATNTKNSKVSYTKTNLKSKKKYYFKIRTYRTVAGKKIYSSYSSVKNVKVK